MLAAILIWLYLSLLLYLYGASGAALLSRLLKTADTGRLGLSWILLLGLMISGTLAAALSLGMGLGALAALLLLAGAILLFAIVRPVIRLSWREPLRGSWLPVAILLLVTLVALSSATQATSNPDTNLYHAQSIRWAESFAAVPGLGNLNGRLAMNSDWLVLNAATSFAFLRLGSLHLIAGLLFLLASFYFAKGLFGLRRQPALLSNWLRILFLPLALRILPAELSSPGTDLPVILLTWLLLALAVEHIEAQSLPGENAKDGPEYTEPTVLRLILVGALPAFIVTLKLSAAPLLLLSAFVFWRLVKQRAPRAVALLAGVMVLILLPWLARSVILSGYLVFPYSKLDIFAFAWKVPSSYVDALRDAVIGWARLPDKDWAVTIGMPLQVWLPAWFGEETLNQRLIILGAGFSPIVFFLKEARKYALPFAVNYIGIWFWLLSAPNLRFGYAFLLACIAFAVSALIVAVLRRLTMVDARLIPTLAAGLLALVLAYTLLNTLDVGSLGRRLLLPLDYARFKTTPCSAGNLQVQCASAYKQCGYQAFPCVPNVPAGVMARGDTLQDGFYSIK